MPQNPTPAAAGDTNPTTPLTPERERMIRIWHEELFRLQDRTAVARREALGDLLAEVDRLRAELDKAAAFCAQRAEYITSILNCHPNNDHDYYRWQGHAESRRQLSGQLGLPVAWPAEMEPRTAPAPAEASAPSQREAGAL
ncbi:hypothetical protein [Streptomyces sp. SID2119]|uniref:hypothetical protein n=1 Tax=Streptomyces sp. SID2119 TaxID=2690253 RepID=UPI0013694591|nr:hypothetical protein [Streptomyces sp. SID2119]MYW30141.1 hypothetical protein [Streptomyces sp. SID2119]